jgi:septum formation protein
MIYLASGSPRRQELLRQLGVAFEVSASNIDESREPQETPEQYVTRVARDKARHVGAQLRAQQPAPIVLGADTEVVLDDEVLGKPHDRAHGLAMLQRLQGRAHEVLTAVVVCRGEREWSALSRSRVTFAAMMPAEIECYWDTGEPAGKAGGYAIQGRGAAFIARLEGSYSGVMGLPVFETAQLLRQAGIKILQ